MIVMMEEGWFWLIPHHRERHQRRNGDGCRNRPAHHVAMRIDLPTECWRGGSPDARPCAERMQEASGPETNQVSADFTYTCRPYAGEGYFLVGDSAAFMDPIFSTGVCVAVNAAVTAAKQVDDILAGRISPGRSRKNISQIEECYQHIISLNPAILRSFVPGAFLMGKGPCSCIER